MANEREVPIFIFNGFLESGKTTMIRRMLQNPDFTDGQHILLIVCEEGLEEFDEAVCKEKHVAIANIDAAESFNKSTMEQLEQAHKPDSVLIEFNGMWDPEMMLTAPYPKAWFIAQILTMVNSETFQNYYTNMRQMTATQFKLTDVVVFNRFDDRKNDKFSYRSACKAQNMRVQVVFEYPSGEIDAAFDASPFDLTQKVIDIPDQDFPTWYFDVMDNAERYDGKVIHVLCRVAKLTAPNQSGFVMGRHVMTCCAEDIQFMGIYCINHMQFEDEAWVYLTGTVKAVDSSVYGEDGGEQLPVLQVSRLEHAPAPEEEVLML